MHLDLHYVDPRLVALYDLENQRGEDTDFYLALAAELDAKTIVDLGCGTGLLTRELAEVAGRTVIGIDPASEMLAYAQRQPGAENVDWVNGIASDLQPTLGPVEADLALMSGNVAQVFLDDDEWLETLKALHDTLRPGGTLAFESRNPLARSWEGWNRETTFFRIERQKEPDGPVETWLEVVDVRPETVSFRGYNRFVNSGEIIPVDSTLRFRTRDEISASLTAAGFSISAIYGDWHQNDFEEKNQMMLFIAKA